jgi:hypothetical protein
VAYNDALAILSFLIDAGETGQRIRGHNWRVSSLGAPETWPVALSGALGVYLGSSLPPELYRGRAAIALQ